MSLSILLCRLDIGFYYNVVLQCKCQEVCNVEKIQWVETLAGVCVLVCTT